MKPQLAKIQMLTQVHLQLFCFFSLFVCSQTQTLLVMDSSKKQPIWDFSPLFSLLILEASQNCLKC